MHLRRRAVTGALALAFLASACTEYDNGNNTLSGRDASPTAPGDPQTTGPAVPDGPFVLEAKDNVFVPATFEVKAGDVSFDMKNTGVAPHTFTNAELKVDVNADGGKTVPVKFTAQPGTYKIICKYHEAVGMVGELKVT